MSGLATIYFAGPIDQAGSGWRQRHEILVREVDRLTGVVGYHPGRAFTVGEGTKAFDGLEAINRAALAACDAVVAFVPASVPSVGVPREIEAALVQNKPVAVCTDLTRAWSLADLRQFDLAPEGVCEAVAHIVQVLGERVPLASDEIVFEVGPSGTLPTRAHAHDAGFDLYVSERIAIRPGDFQDVPLDLRMAMPPGMWGRVVGRSSTLRNRGLMVVEGVIDPGYRGPLYSGVFNLGRSVTVVERGERLAQLIPHTNLAPTTYVRGVPAAEFDALPHDGRGAGGFGSSGG